MHTYIFKRSSIGGVVNGSCKVFRHTQRCRTYIPERNGENTRRTFKCDKYFYLTSVSHINEIEHHAILYFHSNRISCDLCKSIGVVHSWFARIANNWFEWATIIISLEWMKTNNSSLLLLLFRYLIPSHAYHKLRNKRGIYISASGCWFFLLELR